MTIDEFNYYYQPNIRGQNSKSQEEENKIMNSVELHDVYGIDFKYSLSILYQLLCEREKYVNISHKIMPLFEEHTNFVISRPYVAWYMITVDWCWDKTENYNPRIGSIYLTKNNEVGIFILKRYQRRHIAEYALKELLNKHSDRPLYANIAPHNEAGQKFFCKQGFKELQRVYKLT